MGRNGRPFLAWLQDKAERIFARIWLRCRKQIGHLFISACSGLDGLCERRLKRQQCGQNYGERS
jgi:hypothetical protein